MCVCERVCVRACVHARIFINCYVSDQQERLEIQAAVTDLMNLLRKADNSYCIQIYEFTVYDPSITSFIDIEKTYRR